MLTPDYDSELNEEYDDMSCMTRDTGTKRTSFMHAVDKSKSDLNTKRSAAASGSLQDYMDKICHEPSNWEDLEHHHTTHYFVRGRVGTYLGQHAKNKNLGNIHHRKNKTTKIGNASMKKAPNDTDLLLHPPENEDHKGLTDLLAFKSCTAYMGN